MEQMVMTRERFSSLTGAAALAITVLFGVTDAAAQTKASGHRVSKLEIKILSTMLADQGFGEWGFAALVEVDGKRILFDTGANEDTVLRNLQPLGVDLADVDTVILSHNHDDHTTGLLALRRQTMGRSPAALSKVYAGHGIFWPRLDGKGQIDDHMGRLRKDYESTGGTIVEVSAPVEILPGVWLTGPVPRVHPERNFARGGVRTDKGDVEDTVPEDMTLVVQTGQGLVTLFGCGHAGVINTLDHIRKSIDPGPVKTVIGGLHLFAADEKTLSWTAGELKRFEVKELVGAHCTGIESVYRLRTLVGLNRQTCMVGAVGTTYSLARGIEAGRIAK
jgi:7,8-dihydropterin-6-yl-methyl-4-(beta-D-ribofuranosyl)aminobenzene 5'-phosphate synthase